MYVEYGGSGVHRLDWGVWGSPVERRFWGSMKENKNEMGVDGDWEVSPVERTRDDYFRQQL